LGLDFIAVAATILPWRGLQAHRVSDGLRRGC
jgi:hypothetical protein